MHHGYTRINDTEVAVLSSRAGEASNGSPIPDATAHISIQLHSVSAIILFELKPDEAMDLADRLAASAIHAASDPDGVIRDNLSLEAA